MPLTAKDIYPHQGEHYARFPSRRSVVHSTKGIVASSQPLACRAGIKVLEQGGNAADAAVACAAALNITEPGMTGIGGDMFCLFYNAKTKTTHALNGSGRYSGNVTLEGLRKDLGLKDGEDGKIPMNSVHAVTIPGAAAGWVDMVENFGSGRVTLEQVLQPAIELGEEGFPVTQISAHYFRNGERSIKAASPNFAEMLKADPKADKGCRAPLPGEIFRNKNLANTFKLLAKHGKAGFYEGPVADAIIKVTTDLGGHITHEDLKHHADTGSQLLDPIGLTFSGQGIEPVTLWEHPPNGQGLVALMALGMLEELEKTGKIPRYAVEDHNNVGYLHALIEVLRLAFSDGAWFITDPDVVSVPVASLLEPSYLAKRAALFSPTASIPSIAHGSPAFSPSDTVYFSTSDPEGNACSFIISNYGGFGTAIVPRGCGFTLQNRGANFALHPPDSPNIFAPRKRPYHTIIPAMLTNASDGSLHSCYGVMGGFMQPQGHVQVLFNMLVFGMDPQSALDAPRICIEATGGEKEGKAIHDEIYVEEGIDERVIEGLRRLGHNIHVLAGLHTQMFGRGQIIRKHEEDGQLVWSAGSDHRADGHAAPL